MGYSKSRRSYCVSSKLTLCIEEFVHIIFDKFNYVVENISNVDDENEQAKNCLSYSY